MRQLRRSRQGGEGGCDKLRLFEGHVWFLKREPSDPARRGPRVASRVTIGKDYAQCEGVPEA